MEFENNQDPTPDIDTVYKDKKKELRKLQKELERLEELKRKKLRVSSPEIKEISRMILQLERDHVETRDQILELVMEAMERYPLKGRRGSRGPVPPKYRDPKDPGNTWTGRGRMPRWFMERIEEGYSKEEMEIS